MIQLKYHPHSLNDGVLQVLSLKMRIRDKLPQLYKGSHNRVHSNQHNTDHTQTQT